MCGRYEGIDERFTEAEVPAELSLGDYVLTRRRARGGGRDRCGRAAACRACSATKSSHVEDSFTAGLLDCPQYTRPEVADGRAVPPVLLGGDHEAIRRWRLKQALGRTWLRRPELLAKRAAYRTRSGSCWRSSRPSGSS